MSVDRFRHPDAPFPRCNTCPASCRGTRKPDLRPLDANRRRRTPLSLGVRRTPLHSALVTRKRIVLADCFHHAKRQRSRGQGGERTFKRTGSPGRSGTSVRYSSSPAAGNCHLSLELGKPQLQILNGLVDPVRAGSTQSQRVLVSLKNSCFRHSAHSNSNTRETTGTSDNGYSVM